MTMSACLSAAESMVHAVGKLVVQQQGPTGQHVFNMDAVILQLLTVQGVFAAWS